MRITGLHQRMVERNRRRGVQTYVSSLKRLCESTGIEPANNTDPKYDFQIKLNQYYAVRANDDPDYYKVFVLKRDASGVIKPQYESNFIYGVIPPNFQEVTGKQLLKYVRAQNMQNLSSLNAFPNTIGFNQGLNNEHIRGKMGDD
jgi:hypothetical protein|tara:strand:- start:106 stop:540 length:435 start_codon:yes stop_codon:yes gene_type:complete